MGGRNWGTWITVNTQLMSSLTSEVQTMLMLIPLSTQQWAHFKLNPGTRQMEKLTENGTSNDHV